MARKRRTKKKFDRSKYKAGLSRRVKTSKQKMQGFTPDHLNLPEDIALWNPGSGEHTIDIIPYEAGPNDPSTPEGEFTYTVDYLVHKNVGPQKKWYCCPEQWGDEHECPICDERRRLQGEGYDKEVWKGLYPKERNLYNVVVYDTRDEEKKGVQVLDVSGFYFEENIVKLATKKPKRSRRSRKKSAEVELEIPFAMPDESGKIISFDIEAAKGKDLYPKWGGFMFEDRDYEIEEEILDSVYTLDDFLVMPDVKKLAEIFESGKSEEDEEDEEYKEEMEEDIPDLSEEEWADDFEDMDRKELKEYISENDIDVKVYRSMSDEDIRNKIRDIIDGEEEEEESEPVCEFDYEFGKDAGKYDECEDECPEEKWEACLAAQKASKKKRRGRK